MEIKTLEDRWNYLISLDSNIDTDFKYKFIDNFDIKELSEYLSTFNSEWYENTDTQKIYTKQKDTNSIMIANVENAKHGFDLPYRSFIETEDDKLLELIMPIIKKIEKIYNGKHGRIWLAKLPPGKEIPIHIDHYSLDTLLKAYEYYYFLAVDRIHIPITTNEKVIFNVGGEDKHMKIGECWNMNQSILHFVKNDGDTDRIHLVIDLLPYKWL